MAYAIVCLHLNNPQERVRRYDEMSARVLILSPDTGFGGLIQQTLERAGGYEPLLVTSGRQALNIAKKVSFDLAILDADITDISITRLGKDLLRLIPDMRLILIPPESPPPEFDTQSMRISGYLTKPFYLPDLVEIVERSLSPKPVDILATSKTESQTRPIMDQTSQNVIEVTATSAPHVSAQGRLPWLDDVNQAAQLLASLSMASPSQASLLLRGGRLWAYAGQLSQAAMQELAHLVIQDWRRSLDTDQADDSEVDLARYIRLKSTDSEYLLYTTLLEDDLLLALVFNARTPFSEIRSQAVALARALTSPPEKVAQGIGQKGWVAPNTDQHELATEEAAWLFGVRGTEGASDQVEGAAPAGATDEPKLESDEIQQTRWIYEFETEAQAVSGEVEAVQPPQESWANTHGEEIVSPTSSRKGLFSPRISDIRYTCILVPRLPEHILIGDLAGNLSAWMRKIALSFGWRLDYLAVCPGYLQWVAGVAPETSAEEIVQTVRQHTSKMIFAEFPRYQKENLYGDFWAPGYLVVTARKPLSEEVIQKYIHHIRSHQGEVTEE